MICKAKVKLKMLCKKNQRNLKSMQKQLNIQWNKSKSSHNRLQLNLKEPFKNYQKKFKN